MLTKNWWKKIVVIVIGSMIAAYGITLALYAGFGGATLAVLWQGLFGNISYEYWNGFIYGSTWNDSIRGDL